MASAEQLMTAFRGEKSIKGRTALLHTLLSPAAPLRKLAGAGIHRVLGLWLRHGMEEEQTTFLMDILTVLHKERGGKGGEGSVDHLCWPPLSLQALGRLPVPQLPHLTHLLNVLSARGGPGGS